MSCPENAFRYNGTQCACDPGHYLVNQSCLLLSSDGRGWVVESGVSAEPQFFLTTVLSLDSIRRLTQSQAVLLEATLVVLVAWLAFCFAVRLGGVDGGHSAWFRIRWWISRLDFTFDTRHWQVQKTNKLSGATVHNKPNGKRPNNGPNVQMG